MTLGQFIAIAAGALTGLILEIRDARKRRAVRFGRRISDRIRGR